MFPTQSVAQSSQDAAREATQTQVPSVQLTRLLAPNLKLMHHYTAKTCFTMTDDATLHHIWQTVMPMEAFSHEFLLHGLLALAALHYRVENPEPQDTNFTELAQQHQEQALSSYIPLLESIDRNNCHALFAFSSIIGALSYGFLQISMDGVLDYEFVSTFVEIFDLLMGSTAVAVQARQWLRAGALSAMMAPIPTFDNDMRDCNEQSRHALQLLLHHVQHLSLSGNISDYYSQSGSPQETYVSSIVKLGGLFPSQNGNRPTLNELIGWPVFAGPPFISLLKKRDPIALVILAYYGAALHGNSHIWWLQGLGPRLVQSVNRLIDSEWHPYLRWAMTFVQS